MVKSLLPVHLHTFIAMDNRRARVYPAMAENVGNGATL